MVNMSNNSYITNKIWFALHWIKFNKYKINKRMLIQMGSGRLGIFP